MLDIETHDDATPAPGDLEILQRFANLHEHDAEGRTVVAPPEMVRGFLVERGLLEPDAPYTEQDHRMALRLTTAFRALVLADEDHPLPPEEAATIDSASEAAGLHPHFAYGAPVLVPAEGGAAGAFGRLVAIAFLAQFDGTWSHLKQCADEECRALFYDRSRNHSGRWCSMSACGNRAKVRAWRERQREHDDA
ncbi:MAG TPA: CGNR zinc finger domain-containing protein [Actinomycetota bacterium]